MSGWKSTAVLATLVAVSWAVYWLVTVGGHHIPPVPHLYIDPAALDLGSLWEVNHYVCTIPVQNRSSQPVTIAGWYRSCACRKVEPEHLTVNPGETAHIRVTLDLTQACLRQQSTVGAAAGTNAVSARQASGFRIWFGPKVVSRWVKPWEGWNLTGEVRKWLVIEPKEVPLGEVIAGQAVQPAEATLVCYAPVQSLHLSTDEGKLLIQTEQLSAQPNRYRLHIVPHPQLGYGPFDVPVRTKVITPDGQELTGPGFSVFGRIVTRVYAHPAVITVGPVEVGTLVEEEVVLRCRLGKPFEVIEVRVVSHNTNQEDVQIRQSDKGTAVYQLTARVSRVGSLQREVVFRVRTDSGSEETIRVAVVLYGVQADRR